MTMEFDKIKKIRLHTEVARIIENYIEENNLDAKDKLPSERILAEKLGIGRSSLREALRVLESQGVIEVISGKGIFVGSRSSVILDDAFLSNLQQEKITLLELYQVRRPLGALSVDLAARNASDEQIEEIRKNLEAYEEQYRRGDPGKKEDRELHMSLHKASGNFLVYVLFEFIFKHWDNFHFGDETLFPDSVPLHRPVYQAIRDHDPKNAARAYHRLMDYVEERIVEQVAD